MADDTRGWIVQPNPSATYTTTSQELDESGNLVEVQVLEFGELQWAYRRPGDHFIVFSGVSAESDPPSQSAQEHLEASNYEEPQPDSVSAAAEVEARDQDTGAA